MNARRHGVTRTEVMAVLAIAVLVPALVLPAASTLRQRSWAAASADNLRILGATHLVYAADWNGRQLTFVDDVITSYGDNTSSAFNEYWSEHGGGGERTQHPGVALGWTLAENGQRFWGEYRCNGNVANASLTLPVVFSSPSNIVFFGSFRLHNAVQFNQYLGGRFYDPIFYAPTDTIVTDAIGEGFEDPYQYWTGAIISQQIGDVPAWSSYCTSPAAMLGPSAMAHDDPGDPDFNGWVDPWELRDGFTSPSYFHARYPALKTHLLEHHWLQDPPEDPCNPGFDPGTYGDPGCEPYYFNHGLESRPLTLFYDGHVDEIRVADAMAADEQVRDQNNPNWGLWSKDTPWGEDGYLIEYGYDQAQTSFHILTTDGILGRDITAAELGPTARTVRRAPRTTPGVRRLRPALDASAARLSLNEQGDG